MADIFVAVFCIFGEGFWFYTVEWLPGNVGCKIFKFKQMFSLYLSTSIMVLIAVDHFISVKYPLKVMSRGKDLRLIGTCWVGSAVVSIPQAIIFHLEKAPLQEPFFQCVYHNFYTADCSLMPHYAASFSIFYHAVADVLAKMGNTLEFLEANEKLKAEIFFFGMSTSLFNSLIYGLFHVYRPKKQKGLERGISSRKTLMTTLSLRGLRSSTLQQNYPESESLSLIRKDDAGHERSLPVPIPCKMKAKGRAQSNESSLS